MSIGTDRTYATRLAAACAVSLAAVALVAIPRCAAIQGRDAANVGVGPPGRRVAVTMGAGRTFVHVVDVDRMELVRSCALRSFAVYSAFDTSTASIVTAQCGGLGTEADRACAILPVRPPGIPPRYLTLPAGNPTDVATLAGRAVVVHGLLQHDGFVATALDLQRGRVRRQGHVPATPQRLSTCGGRILLTVSRGDDSRRRSELGQVDAKTLAYRRIASLPLAAAVAIEDPRSTPSRPTALVVGVRDLATSRARAQTSEVWRIDVLSGAVLAHRRIPGLRAGAADAAAEGDTLAVLDADLAGGAGAGGAALYDLDTLAPRGRIAADVPCDVAVAGDRVLLVDGNGTLVVARTRDGSQIGRISLGSPGWSADIELLTSGTSQGETAARATGGPLCGRSSRSSPSKATRSHSRSASCSARHSTPSSPRS